MGGITAELKSKLKGDGDGKLCFVRHMCLRVCGGCNRPRQAGTLLGMMLPGTVIPTLGVPPLDGLMTHLPLAVTFTMAARCGGCACWC